MLDMLVSQMLHVPTGIAIAALENEVIQKWLTGCARICYFEL